MSKLARTIYRAQEANRRQELAAALQKLTPREQVCSEQMVSALTDFLTKQSTHSGYQDLFWIHSLVPKDCLKTENLWLAFEKQLELKFKGKVTVTELPSFRYFWNVSK